MSENQLHQPNPRVNRERRPEILGKRIRNLRNKQKVKGLSPKLERRLANYKAELNQL